jgi:DNA-binding response OmpR family regulator
MMFSWQARVPALRPPWPVPAGSTPAVTTRPLLVLVAPYDGETGSAALDAGADDFLRPPIMAPEPRARLKALLRPH